MLQPLSQNTLTLRRSRVYNFTGIIKIPAMFIKTTYSDSNKIKRVRNYL